MFKELHYAFRQLVIIALIVVYSTPSPWPPSQNFRRQPGLSASLTHQALAGQVVFQRRPPKAAMERLKLWQLIQNAMAPNPREPEFGTSTPLHPIQEKILEAIIKGSPKEEILALENQLPRVPEVAEFGTEPMTTKALAAAARMDERVTSKLLNEREIPSKTRTVQGIRKSRVYHSIDPEWAVKLADMYSLKDAARFFNTTDNSLYRWLKIHSNQKELWGVVPLWRKSDKSDQGWRMAGRRIAPLVDRHYRRVGFAQAWKALNRLGYPMRREVCEVWFRKPQNYVGVARAKEYFGDHGGIRSPLDSYGRITFEDLAHLMILIKEQQSARNAKKNWILIEEAAKQLDVDVSAFRHQVSRGLVRAEN